MTPERYPVGTYLLIPNPAKPLTRQLVLVLGYVGPAYALRFLADDELTEKWWHEDETQKDTK